MISFISWWEVKPQAHNIIAHQGTHRAFMLIGVGKLVDGCFRQKSRYSFFSQLVLSCGEKCNGKPDEIESAEVQ